MRTMSDIDAGAGLKRFDRTFFDPAERFRTIGDGELGGKASGLAFAAALLRDEPLRDRFPLIEISIPSLVILTTEVFDSFLGRNHIAIESLAGESDEAIARLFQRAELPTEVLGDLRALVQQVHSPLAVRSSSLLEDALSEPFAGVYGTKMIPNSQPSADDRFRRLCEAVKLVYASTYFREARAYRDATGQDISSEKMAVIIQEVVGRRFGDRYYPEVSGVGRSFNYYPSGPAGPQDGVVSLALGLGKSIVDGDLCWTYSPAFPASPPPFATAAEIASQTQTKFWAVNMGAPPEYDPVLETEYLIHSSLEEAELDGTLSLVASTLDRQSGRIRMGIGTEGPRVIDFSMLLVLREVPLNEAVAELLHLFARELREPVEIEFAMSFNPHRLGFLQVRPMMVSSEAVTVDEDMTRPELLAWSDRVLGNGVIAGVSDVIFVRPDTFEAKHTRAIAAEIDELNKEMLRQRRPYVLVGFGRWGSADPWLGIPVNWAQISGARVIVEAMRPEMNVELSQGSHFFHNLISFRVPYFSIAGHGRSRFDWEWLEQQTVVRETKFLKRVATSVPLTVKIDGRTGRGMISRKP